MKHIKPNFRPINITLKKNIHGTPLKPRIIIETKVTWPEKMNDSQTKGNLRKYSPK